MFDSAKTKKSLTQSQKRPYARAGQYVVNTYAKRADCNYVSRTRNGWTQRMCRHRCRTAAVCEISNSISGLEICLA